MCRINRDKRNNRQTLPETLANFAELEISRFLRRKRGIQHEEKKEIQHGGTEDTEKKYE
jgi:hypothetical protein